MLPSWFKVQKPHRFQTCNIVQNLDSGRSAATPLKPSPKSNKPKLLMASPVAVLKPSYQSSDVKHVTLRVQGRSCATTAKQTAELTGLFGTNISVVCGSRHAALSNVTLQCKRRVTQPYATAG
jgi:hypothetical protein